MHTERGADARAVACERRAPADQSRTTVTLQSRSSSGSAAMHLLRRRSLQAGLAARPGARPLPVADAQAQAQWQPTKPIEFVIMAGKGGGADLIVRNMAEIIAKHKLTPVPITPVNIAGGSGADATGAPQEAERRRSPPAVHAQQLLHDAAEAAGPRPRHRQLRADRQDGGGRVPALGPLRPHRHQDARRFRQGGQGQGRQVDHGGHGRRPGGQPADRFPQFHLRPQDDIQGVRGRRRGGKGACREAGRFHGQQPRRAEQVLSEGA